MTTAANEKPARDERREHPRVASGQPAHAAALCDQGFAAKVLHDLEVENVSAGGMAVISSTPVEPGHKVMLDAPAHGLAAEASGRVTLEALDCTAWRDGKYIIRLRVREGSVPAQLMFNW